MESHFKTASPACYGSAPRGSVATAARRVSLKLDNESSSEPVQICGRTDRSTRSSSAVGTTGIAAPRIGLLFFDSHDHVPNPSVAPGFDTQRPPNTRRRPDGVLFDAQGFWRLRRLLIPAAFKSNLGRFRRNRVSLRPRANLRHAVAVTVEVRHPDVGAVKGYARGI